MQSNLDVNPVFEAWKTDPNRENLTSLLEKMERFAKGICYQRLSDHTSDLDALANGIVWKALQKSDQFEGKAKFSTWFYKIAVNECHKFLREHKRRNEVELTEDLVDSTGKIIGGLEFAAWLHGLDNEDRQLAILVLNGHRFEEIGEHLGITAGNARVRWSRLKGRFRNAD